MCGRFVIAGSKADLLAAFDIDEAPDDDIRASWNVAPTDAVSVVVEDLDPETGELTRRLETARWGLVPSWAKSPAVGARMINARSETVLEKPSFRSAALRRRGLVPANGYYEWRKNADGSKTPVYLHAEPESAHLAFAGLYEFWKDPAAPSNGDSSWLMTCTIITRPASDALGSIHDRTPVIVPPNLFGEWLDPKNASKPKVQHLLDSIPDPTLVPRLVGSRVGSVRNNGPDLIEPLVPGGEDTAPGETAATLL